MTTTTLLIIIAASFGAAFIQRATGFGFGIFIMTVLPYVMPSYGEATTLSGMLALLTALILVIRYFREVRWRRLWPILLTFLAVSFVAVRLVAVVDDATLRPILGVTLIAAALYFWCLSSRVRLRPTLPTQLSLGTLSGLMGGLFGMQGPPAVLYFIEVSETKEEYIAITQMYFLVGNIVMTCYRANEGFLTPTVWTAWCYGAGAVVLGTWLGSLIFRYLSLPLLRRIVFAYIALSGVLALLK